MHVEIVEKTPLNFITLNDAKRQLNIVDNTSDDIHISNLVKTAMELSELATHRKLSKTKVHLIMTVNGTANVPYGNVVDLLSVTTLDGVDVDFTFNKVKQEIKINGSQELSIIYESGEVYDDADKIPHAIKMGAKVLISDFYENRESTVIGVSVNTIPLSAKSLFDSQKLDYV